jgi:ribosomal protein L37AE/L43A
MGLLVRALDRDRQLLDLPSDDLRRRGRAGREGVRNLTSEEQQVLMTHGTCPFCQSRDIQAGPQGGLMTNWYCGGCGAGFNLPPLNIPMTGQLIREPQDA